MSLIAHFFAGFFLCNSIPHLASGLQGQRFPTPFAKPRRVGSSSPTVNFLWGLGNAVLGACLLASFPIASFYSPGTAALLAGALVIGVYLSVHFAKVRARAGGGEAEN